MTPVTVEEVKLPVAWKEVLKIIPEVLPARKVVIT